MSKIKKMLGVLMAAMLCFALTPMAAFATPVTNSNQGTIKITNAIDGKDYDIYQVLELVRYDNDTKSYSYKAASEKWGDFLQTDAAKAYVEVSKDGYVTWVNEDKNDNVDLPVSRDVAIAKFAELAINYAKKNGIKPTKSVTAEGSTVEFTNLSLGYYLVDSSTGAICSLATTNTDATIVEKNGVPTVDKKVQEDSNIGDANEGYGPTNDAQIGDIVNFKTVITGQPGAVNYVLHDEMSKGLTFDPASVVVKRDNKTLVAGTDYNLIENPSDDCTFELKLTKSLCDKLGENDDVVVTYSATLNENAVVAGDGNPNKTKLNYGDGTNIHETPESTTKTYTWSFDVFKHDEANNPLAGAKFTLSLNKEGTDLLKFIDLGDNTYKIAPEGNITEIVTDDTGRFVIQGLDSKDKYYLTETEAPEGFNKLEGSREVILDTNADAGVLIPTASVDVRNQAGLQLPSTGGIGTTIFYIVGGVLVVGAIAFLIVRRRMNSAK